MASFNPLALAWLVYALASLLMIFICWRATRNWRPVVLWRLVRVALALLLITPAYVEQGVNALAPAWVVTVFIAAGEGLAAARPAYLPLVSALALGSAMVVVGATVQALRKGGAPVATPPARRGPKQQKRGARAGTSRAA